MVVLNKSLWQPLPLNEGSTARIVSDTIAFKSDPNDSIDKLLNILHQAEHIRYVNEQGLIDGNWLQLLLWDPLLAAIYLSSREPNSWQDSTYQQYLSRWKIQPSGKVLCEFIQYWLTLTPMQRHRELWKNRLIAIIHLKMSKPQGDQQPHIGLLLAGIKLHSNLIKPLNQYSSQFLTQFFHRLGLEKFKQQAHIIYLQIENKPNITEILPTGSRFDGGIDQGEVNSFVSDHDVTINPVQIDTIRHHQLKNKSGEFYTAQLNEKDISWPLFQPNQLHQVFICQWHSALMSLPCEELQCRLFLHLPSENNKSLMKWFSTLTLELKSGKTTWLPKIKLQIKQTAFHSHIKVSFNRPTEISNSELENLRVLLSVNQPKKISHFTEIKHTKITRARLYYRANISQQVKLLTPDSEITLPDEYFIPWLGARPQEKISHTQIKMPKAWSSQIIQRIKLRWQWMTFNQPEMHFLTYRKLLKEWSGKFAIKLINKDSSDEIALNDSNNKLSLSHKDGIVGALNITLITPSFGLGHNQYTPLYQRQWQKINHWQLSRNFLQRLWHILKITPFNWFGKRYSIWQKLIGKPWRNNYRRLLNRWRYFNIEPHFPRPLEPLELHARKMSMQIMGVESWVENSQLERPFMAKGIDGQFTNQTSANWFSDDFPNGACFELALSGSAQTSISLLFLLKKHCWSGSESIELHWQISADHEAWQDAHLLFDGSGSLSRTGVVIIDLPEKIARSIRIRVSGKQGLERGNLCDAIFVNGLQVNSAESPLLKPPSIDTDWRCVDNPKLFISQRGDGLTGLSAENDPSFWQRGHLWVQTRAALWSKRDIEQQLLLQLPELALIQYIHQKNHATATVAMKSLTGWLQPSPADKLAVQSLITKKIKLTHKLIVKGPIPEYLQLFLPVKPADESGFIQWWSKWLFEHTHHHGLPILNKALDLNHLISSIKKSWPYLTYNGIRWANDNEQVIIPKKPGAYWCIPQDKTKACRYAK